MSQEPNLLVLAGPNGTGKSTAGLDVLRGAFHVEEFVNADVIARGFSAFHGVGGDRCRPRNAGAAA
jgi:predicted ABC-type ATPase